MNISNISIFTSPEVHQSTSLTSQNHSLSDDLTFSLLCFNVIVGLPLNSYVLWLTATGRGIALDFFSFNLTICEIIYCLNSLVYTLIPTFQSLFIVHTFLKGIAITGCPLFQCLICVERYLAVIHPVTFLKFKPLRYRLMCCISVWITTLCSSLFCLNTIAEKNPIFFIWWYSVQFLIFFFIQLFCVLAVLRGLKQSGPGERGREREEENHTKRKAFHLILIATVTILIMFVPYIVTGFVTILTKQGGQTGWIVSLACFCLATLVHPVLYLRRAGKLFCFHLS